MENVTLEGVVERLDRLEKVVGNINLQLSLLVKELVSNATQNRETSDEITQINTKNENQDANIGVKIIEDILEQMGYPPDFDPGPIEELHESMKQHGIRAENNEFSRAIIEEREK